MKVKPLETAGACSVCVFSWGTMPLAGDKLSLGSRQAGGSLPLIEVGEIIGSFLSVAEPHRCYQQLG